MILNKIFELIGSLFTDFLFLPFEWLRLEVATAGLGWWISNAVNWGFLIVLLFLLRYWMNESRRFLKEGTEDKA